MALANQEAQRFNHEYIGTEHILLGLVKEGSGVGATVLKNLDVDIKKLRLEVEKLVKSGPDMVTMGKLPQTPRAKKVIEYAIEEARALNHNYVGTEHILLGLLRESEGVAAQVLMNLGLELDAVRGEMFKLLSPEGRESSPPADICRGLDENPAGRADRDDSQTWEQEAAEGIYGDLHALRKADALARQVYAVAGTFPREEIPDLAYRLRELALSIPPYIMEARDRSSPAEARWFLNTAFGSLRQLRYLLGFSKERGWLKDLDYELLDALAEKVDRLLREFYTSLK